MKLVSGIVDSGFFAQSALSAEVATKDSLGRNISETYLTGVDLSDYATEDWVTGQGYLTAHQSLDGLMSANLLEISDNKITGYNGTAFAGQGGVSGDLELSAGSGISIVDYPLDQKTVISVTAQGGNPEVEQAVIDNSATWNTVSDKLDTTAFSTVSSDFITALPQDLVYTADIADMATTGDLTGKQDITGMTAYATVESLTAKQDAGDYLSATDSANFLLTSDSANFYTTANESGFITGVDLTPYQLTADMTAYQPVGDYMTTADSANFYTTANESGFISEVPAGTMNESAFGYDANDKISGYNGSAFAGGSEVPEGVMVESGLEYNAVNEISGYNGSAIAQYGAEKQWLVHDDTLVHASNSAQFALGVNLSAVAQLLGVDETVLWSGDAISGISASEPMTGFNRIRIKYSTNTNSSTIYGSVHEYKEIDPSTLDHDFTIGTITNNGSNSTNNMLFINTEYSATSNYTVLNIVHSYQVYNNAGTWTTGTNNRIRIKELVGIGRKQ